MTESTPHVRVTYEIEVDASNANAEVSSKLPYILKASRFAHSLKVIIRDKNGSHETARMVESYFNAWISGDVLETDDAGQDIMANYPLLKARTEVREVQSEPGVFQAMVVLRPH